MKKTLTLLVATTALTAALGVPAFSALHVSDGSPRTGNMIADDGAHPLPLILASDDDDDDDHGWRTTSRRGDDDDDDDDGGCRNGARNPAPAGTVAPPQNGLFGNGAPPQVQVN
jgi:hypothetical protein